MTCPPCRILQAMGFAAGDLHNKSCGTINSIRFIDATGIDCVREQRPLYLRFIFNFNFSRRTTMQLKGSKTHQHLKDAFAGESQANRRYLYFAAKADVEGQNDVARW